MGMEVDIAGNLRWEPPGQWPAHEDAQSRAVSVRADRQGRSRVCRAARANGLHELSPHPTNLILPANVPPLLGDNPSALLLDY